MGTECREHVKVGQNEASTIQECELLVYTNETQMIQEKNGIQKEFDLVCKTEDNIGTGM